MVREDDGQIKADRRVRNGQAVGTSIGPLPTR